MPTFVNDINRWDEDIARFLGDIIERAFPGQELPGTIAYAMRDELACDAIIYGISADFEVAGSEASVSFDFFTGEGGLKMLGEPDPPPSISSVSVTFEDEEGEEHRWDPDTDEWQAEKDAE